MSDVGEGEARRNLMTKLPTFMASSIFKKELEKSRTSKNCKSTQASPFPPTKCGVYPRKEPGISIVPGGQRRKQFYVLMPTGESVERLLTYHNLEIVRSVNPLQVKKIPVQFTVVDIFDLLEEPLGEAEDLRHISLG